MTGSTKSAEHTANKRRQRLAENECDRFVRSWGRRHREQSGALRRCQQCPSEKNIHDVRVSTRRLLAHLEVLRSLSAGPIEKTRRRLKRIMRITASLRDAQVQAQRLDRLTRRNRHSELRPVKHHLKKRTHRLQLVVARKLSRREPKLDPVRLRKILVGPLPTSAGETRLRKAGDEALRATVRTVQSRLRRAALTRSASAEHRARVAVKKLRYLIEAIASQTAQSGKALKQLHAIQSALGKLHDFDIFLQRLKKSAGRYKRIAAWLRIRRKTLRRQRITMVAATPSLNIRLKDLRQPGWAGNHPTSQFHGTDARRAERRDLRGG